MILETEKYPECSKCQRPFPSIPAKYGCDFCKKVLACESIFTLRVFFDTPSDLDESLEYHFCDWSCIPKWLKTPVLEKLVKNKKRKVQFIDLPTVHPEDLVEFNKIFLGKR